MFFSLTAAGRFVLSNCVARDYRCYYGATSARDSHPLVGYAPKLCVGGPQSYFELVSIHVVDMLLV